MKHRAMAVLLPVLLAAPLIAEGGAPGWTFLGADERETTVRLPPAETFGIGPGKPEPRRAPRRPLPLAAGDEGSGRNPISGGTGWLVIFEVSFTPAKESGDRDVSNGHPAEGSRPSPGAAAAA